MLWEILNNFKLLDLFFFLKSRFNLICVHFDFSSDELDSMSSTERISFLQEKLQEIRKYYMTLKSEVASIDRRRKRLKKKEREGRRGPAGKCWQSSASFLLRALLHQYLLCLTRFVLVLMCSHFSHCQVFKNGSFGFCEGDALMTYRVMPPTSQSVAWHHIFESPRITWNPSWVGTERVPGTRYYHQIELT